MSCCHILKILGIRAFYGFGFTSIDADFYYFQNNIFGNISRSSEIKFTRALLLLCFVIVSQRVFQLSRNMQHKHNIRREKRKKIDKIDESSKKTYDLSLFNISITSLYQCHIIIIAIFINGSKLKNFKCLNLIFPFYLTWFSSEMVFFLFD